MESEFGIKTTETTHVETSGGWEHVSISLKDNKMENKTQNETVLAHELCPGDAYETNEQKAKRRVPSYFLIRDITNNPYGSLWNKFATKKDLKEYLEANDLEAKNPVVILGHEVPITFNKIVKVDF